MAGEVPTQGNQILVNSPDSEAEVRQAFIPGHELTSWVMGNVNPWERFRNSGYNGRWAEYWRMWRGQWSPADKNRLSERSRLIAPALAQAIEMAVAEIEEAVFSKEAWFDVQDDLEDQEKRDATIARDLLLEDLERVNAKDAASEAVLNAAIFGTGILMVNTEVRRDEKPGRNPDTKALENQGQERVYVSWESVRPDEFIPDPSGVKISEMLGCARKIASKPLHAVLEKIEAGVYRQDALPRLAPAQRSLTGADVDHSTDHQANQTLNSHNSQSVEIVEYHGKVPLRLLNKINERPPSLLDAVIDHDLQSEAESTNTDGPLVEAIVTIANGSVLLRAMLNPFTMTDRSVIACQYEKVPGRFWGRGVAEKGYNPQKALDAEMRGRIDALGFISAPMIGVNSGLLPRGFRMEVKPGKVWPTTGDPGTAVQAVQIGNLQPNTFNQTQELTQMVQMGTGAFDTASSLQSQTQSGGSGATTNSVFLGAFVKRSKRAIQNIDRNLLGPAIRKSMLRYMQFAPGRYPSDQEFQIKATLGIVAREVEQLNLTQLMAMLPQEFPEVAVAVAQGIIELSAVTNKADIMAAMEQALAPPSPEEQQRAEALKKLEFETQRATATDALLQNQKTMAEIREILAKTKLASRRADVEDEKVEIEQQRIELQEEEIEQFRDQNQLAFERLELARDQFEAKQNESTSD